MPVFSHGDFVHILRYLGAFCTYTKVLEVVAVVEAAELAQVRGDMLTAVFRDALA